MGKERDIFLKNLPNNLIATPVDAIKIGKRLVGNNQPVFIIAEVGANHRGKIENALKAIEIAAKSGADAVKFQHLTGNLMAADTMVFDQWHGKPIGPLSKFYKSAELPYGWTEKLINHAKKHNIIFLSTPFDKSAVDLLTKFKIPAFKIASYEMTDDILLRYIAKKGKPMILSTGMAYLEEVAHAVRVIQEAGNNQIILLHCVSIYPPKNFSDLNLRAITTLRESFKVPVGYSDHSVPPSVSAPLGAVALGACVIEKHFTDSAEGGSNDDPNSLSPNELSNMIKEIRLLEKALSGSGIKQPISYKNHIGDEISDRWARRSLYAKINIAKGAVINESMLITLRPFGGLEIKDLKVILGKKANKKISARSPIKLGDFS